MDKPTMRQRGLAAFAALVLLAVAPVAQADQGNPVKGLPPADLPDVAQPQIDDPISDAELEDLKRLASQKGISLQAAIDRYAWNDNFALAVATVRESFPEALSGAAIVDSGTAWVAFAAGAPDKAIEIIQAFEKANATVAVEVRPDFGFTEAELEKAIAAVHYAVFEGPNVRDATTSFDLETRQITSVVALEIGVADSALADLRAGATESLVDSGLGGILDSVAVSVVRSSFPALGGRVDNTAHIGGESLSTCTSGFVVKNGAGSEGSAPPGIAGTIKPTTVSLSFSRLNTAGVRATSSGTRGRRVNPTTSMRATRPRLRSTGETSLASVLRWWGSRCAGTARPRSVTAAWT